MVGDRAAGEVKFRRTRIPVDNAPIAAHSAFQRTLPGLVESLNDVDLDVLTLRQRQGCR